MEDKDKTEGQLLEEFAKLCPQTTELEEFEIKRKSSEGIISQRTEDLALLNSLNQAVNRGDSLQEILNLLSEEIKRIFSCMGATLYLMSKDKKHLTLQKSAILPASTKHRVEKIIGMKIPTEIKITLKAGSLYRKVLQEGKSRLITDPKTIHKLISEFTENKILKRLAPKIYKILNIRSVINVPLVSEGEAIGLMDVSSNELFSETEQERLEIFSEQLTSILKHKHMEEENRRQNEFLNSVLESLTHPFYVIDVHDYTVKIANSASRLGNLSESTTCYALTHNRSKPCKGIEHLCPIREVKKTKKPVVLEHIHYDKRGDSRNVEISAYPIFDENGNVIQIIESALDITERKQAEKVLGESEEHYRELADSISDVFFEMDKDLKYTYWNKASDELTGISAKDAIGKSLYELFPDMKGTEAEKKYLEVLRTQKPRNFMNEFQLGDKNYFFEISAYPSKRGLSVFTEDITERKLAEEDLREKEEFNFALFQHNPAHTIVVDQEGRVIKTNMAKRKSGDRVPNIGDVMYKDYAGRHEIDMRSELMECIRQGETKMFPGLKYDDKFLNISIASFPKGAIITSQDITEQKRAEKEKERLQAQLIQSEKMAGIGTLASGIAHEFNNLLHIMRGHAEFAQSTKKAEDMEEALDVVLKTSDEVAKIIGDILTFAREEPSKKEKETGDINESIEGVLSLMEEYLRKQNIEIVRKYGRTPRIEMNMGEMQQVFLNIVNNARDAMLPKGGKLEIETKRLNENIEVSISDTGKGIEKENLGKLCEPFYTTKRTEEDDSEFPGTGLGLSVSYGIVKRHGGKIEVKSKINKGTTFIVKLPLKE